MIVLGEYRHGIAQSRNRTSYEDWLVGLLHDSIVLDITEPTTHYYAEIGLSGRFVLTTRRKLLRVEMVDEDFDFAVLRAHVGELLAGALGRDVDGLQRCAPRDDVDSVGRRFASETRML